MSSYDGAWGWRHMALCPGLTDRLARTCYIHDRRLQIPYSATCAAPRVKGIVALGGRIPRRKSGRSCTLRIEWTFPRVSPSQHGIVRTCQCAFGRWEDHPHPRPQTCRLILHIRTTIACCVRVTRNTWLSAGKLLICGPLLF